MPAQMSHEENLQNKIWFFLSSGIFLKKQSRGNEEITSKSSLSLRQFLRKCLNWWWQAQLAKNRKLRNSIIATNNQRHVLAILEIVLIFSRSLKMVTLVHIILTFTFLELFMLEYILHIYKSMIRQRI